MEIAGKLWVEYPARLTIAEATERFIDVFGYPPDQVDYASFGSKTKLFAGPVTRRPSDSFDVVVVEDSIDVL